MNVQPMRARLRQVLALITLGAAAVVHAQSHSHQHGQERAQGTTGNSAEFYAARTKVMQANPELRNSIMRGGAFSSEFSAAIANRMYSRTDAAAIADAKAKLQVEQHGPGTWLLRLPFVNIAVFETKAGLVLVDSGYAPAGPALLEALRTLSKKPVHTIIFSHYHADHAFGAWALLEAGMKPQIIAEERFIEQMEYDMLTHGVIARNNNQYPEDVPKSWSDAIRPTKTYHKQMKLKIGGEVFELYHSRGETEDHTWVHVPGRQIIVTADLFQDFLPNAGNGKRRQRYAGEWAQTLRHMASLKPQKLLPMHGPAVTNPAEIQRRLPQQALMLETIVKQVVDGLNNGERRDLVVDRVALPADLAKEHDARETYVSARDVGRMVVKEMSGWWDDVPSNWDPAPLSEQARELALLAGGADKLLQRALALPQEQSALAIKLADWAWLADEQNPQTLRDCLKVYARHVSQPKPTQEATIYAEHMIRLQQRLDELERP